MTLRHGMETLALWGALLAAMLRLHILAAGISQLKGVPSGYSVPSIARSPDGRYGVLVPDLDEYEWGEEQNKLIDLRTGRVLGVIHAHSGAVRANHVSIEAGNWSRDRSMFLWRVAGKWCPTALVLIKVQDGKLAWQVNVLEVAQQAILTRTRKRQPHRYMRAKHENRGSGAAFPDGLTVDVQVAVAAGKSLVFPLKVRADLTADPKGIESYPNDARLESELTGVLSKSGRFRVTSFKITNPP